MQLPSFARAHLNHNIMLAWLAALEAHGHWVRVMALKGPPHSVAFSLSSLRAKQICLQMAKRESRHCADDSIDCMSTAGGLAGEQESGDSYCSILRYRQSAAT